VSHAPDRSPALSLIVPCYNEEAVLRTTATRMLRRFDEEGIAIELVMVDNGSSDGTGAAIDALISEGLPVLKVHVPVNRGYGYGVLQGLAAGTAPWMGTIPADGQVDEADVLRLFMVVAGGEPRLAKARRRFRMDGFQRKIVSIIYNGLINVLFGGLRSIDINGTPKLFPRSFYDQARLGSHDWFLDAEIMIKAKRLRLPVLEMNVLAQARGGGTSNVGATTVTEFLRNLAKARFKGLPEGHDPSEHIQSGEVAK